MKEKILKLEKLIIFLKENNMDLISCECCSGIGIIIDDIDISNMTICNIEDMKELLKKLKDKKDK